MTSATGPEFFFAVHLSLIGANGAGAQYEFKASADQCSALALRFGCVEIPRFEIKANVVPLRKPGLFRVSGDVTARVVQNCVVSLEPVVSDHEVELGLLLLPESKGEAPELEDESEDFEFYSGNTVDLGEIGAIELALALDPYPRAPGISVTDLGPGGVDSGYEVYKEGFVGRNRPFEALAALKRKG
ncbi:MAG: DUF177 domain-containing protein [Proteobacteria bacterium]|nr:DUF177 domain-containing protein [Pseudomonadota bacterium]